jgi:hypothetical protein
MQSPEKCCARDPELVGKEKAKGSGIAHLTFRCAKCRRMQVVADTGPVWPWFGAIPLIEDDGA